MKKDPRFSQKTNLLNFNSKIVASSSKLIDILSNKLSGVDLELLRSWRDLYSNEFERLQKLLLEELDRFEYFEKKPLNQDLRKLNRRQMKVLEYLKEFEFITRREYTAMFNINFMTAYRDLNQLVESGFLMNYGVGRGTKYCLRD